MLPGKERRKEHRSKQRRDGKVVIGVLVFVDTSIVIKKKREKFKLKNCDVVIIILIIIIIIYDEKIKI